MVVQKAAFTINIPHIISRSFLHSMQKPNHTSSVQSLISRFCVQETLQIKSLKFLIFKIPFCLTRKKIPDPGRGVILHTCPKGRHNHLSNSDVAELPIS